MKFSSWLISCLSLFTLSSAVSTVPSGVEGPMSTIIHIDGIPDSEQADTIKRISGSSVGSIETPTMKWWKPAVNMTVAVVFAPYQMCGSAATTLERPANWTGDVAVLYRFQNLDTGIGCVDAEVFTKNAKRVGADAAFYRGYFHPVGAVAHQIYSYPVEPESYGIPCILLDVDVSDRLMELLSSGKSKYVVVQLIDTHNPWDDVFFGPVWRIYQALAVLLYISTFYISGYKYREFYEQDKGFKFTVAQMCLISNIIATFLKVLFIVDPFGKTQVYPYELARFLVAAALPFEFGAMLLMILYFHDITSNTSGKNDFMSKASTRVTVIGASVFIILLDWFCAAMNVWFDLWFLTVVEQGIIVIYALFLSVTYYIMGRRLLATLAKGTKLRGGTSAGAGGEVTQKQMEQEKKYATMSRFIVLNSVTTGMFVLSLALFAVFNNASIPATVGTDIFITFTSSAQAWITSASFQVRSKKEKVSIVSGGKGTTKQADSGATSNVLTSAAGGGGASSVASKASEVSMRSEMVSVRPGSYGEKQEEEEKVIHV